MAGSLVKSHPQQLRKTTIMETVVFGKLPKHIFAVETGVWITLPSINCVAARGNLRPVNSLAKGTIGVPFMGS
jgi:hypothetical protein